VTDLEEGGPGDEEDAAQADEADDHKLRVTQRALAHGLPRQLRQVTRKCVQQGGQGLQRHAVGREGAAAFGLLAVQV
jgi:hypothetical protein